MVKLDYLTERAYLEKDERLISVPRWMRKFLSGAEFALYRVRGEPEVNGDD